MLESIKEVIKYRETLYYLTKKNLVAKYKRNVLGFFWSLLDPILMLIVYTIVFSNLLARDIDNFSLFLFVGLMPWRVFSISMNSGCTSVISYSYMIKTIYFPRLIIPISIVLVEVINYILTIPVVLGMIIFFSDIALTWNVLYLPIVLVVEMILCFAVAIFLSSVTIFFRDVTQIINIATLMLFYLSAIVFPIDMMPNDVARWLKLNPILHIINAYRDVFYYGNQPDFGVLIIIASISLILLLVAIKVFVRLAGNFAEEV